MGFSPVTSVDAPYKAAAVPRLILRVPRLGGELVPNQNESSNRVRCTRPSEWFDGLGQAVGLERRPSAFRPRICHHPSSCWAAFVRASLHSLRTRADPDLWKHG